MGNMFEGLMFPVKATVVQECGSGCRAPHQEGQAWYMRGVPPGICSFAFNVMFPAYWTLRFGGSDPASPHADQMRVVCSQPGCGAEFQLERISEEEAAVLDAQASIVTIDDLLKTIPNGLSRKTA